MAIKKAIYRVDDGNDLDEIHFRTSEDMLVNILQNLSGTGYRKLPGGLILQWGSGRTRFKAGSGGYVSEESIAYPLTFPSNCCMVFAVPNSRTANFKAYYSYQNSGTLLPGAILSFESTGGADCDFMWYALGY